LHRLTKQVINGYSTASGLLHREVYPILQSHTVLDSEAAHSNPQAPPVLIESVTLERDPLDFQRGVTIQPGQRGLEIGYTGLSFIHSEQIKFKYKLEGLEADWVDAGTRRVAYFPYLPPGSYTFRVIAANSDGVWNNEGISIAVIVRAPFWQQLWFWILCTGAVTCSAVFAIRGRVAQLKKKQAERETFSRRLIESQEGERKRLAGELHDSLGQNLLIVKNWALMGLNTLAEDNPAREHLNEISETTSLALDEVREIASNLRPYQLERLGLTNTIEHMIGQVKNASEIEFITEIDNIDELLSKESEINLYRVVPNTKAHGSGPKVQPLPVATGAVGEATEGKLVRIRGTITQPIFNDPPFGSIIFINDGSGEIHSFVNTSTGIDVSGLSQGQTIEVTGFSGQFETSYEVDPRFQDDIKVIP
jgi:Y_Y_Y domain/Histidine kinase